MKDSKKIKKLLVRRNNVVGSVKLIKQFDENFVFDRDFPQLKFRLEKLDELWEEFKELQAEIECDEEIGDEISPVRVSFETDYFQLKGSLAEKIAAVAPSVNPNRPPPSPVAQPAHAIAVRLPEIKIPEFDGNFDEWTNFYDLFLTLIHTNPQLSSVQKFQYLKAVLKGEALRIVQSLAVSTANYTIAWDSLRKRYDNTNLQIKQQFSALLATTAIRKESAAALSNLADEFDKRVCVLNKLENCDAHWNSFLVELLSSKLDPTTQKEWETQLDNERRPIYADLVAFVQKRSRILQSLTLSQPSQQLAKLDPKPDARIVRNKTTLYHSSSSDNHPKCTLCKQSHSLPQCEEFKRLSPQKRFDIAKRNGLCLNCLRSSHLLKNCAAGSCRTCNKRHHTLLHLNNFGIRMNQSDDQSTIAVQMAQCAEITRSTSVVDAPPSVPYIADQCHIAPRAPVPPPSDSPGSHSFVPPSVSNITPSGSALYSPQVTNCQAAVPVCSHSPKIKQQSAVFMLTAYIRVQDIDGTFHLARALLDCASEANFVTESLAQTLRLKRAPANIDVYGISQSVKKVKQQVPIVISSRVGSYKSSMNFLILPSLTRILPTANVDVSKWVLPRNLPLADPKFNIAHDVDMIIGIKSFFAILEDEQITIGNGLPILRKTVFGYVVAGEAFESQNRSVVCNVSTTENLTSLVRKFWEVEGFEDSKSLTLEEQYCEAHFAKTHFRAPDGRYVVRLPIRNEMLPALGESFGVAKRRLSNVERVLLSNPHLHSEYLKFMDEYQTLGHMMEVTPDHSIPHFYLPHHAIQKPESTTTKTRVVFDASCRGSNNLSLNDLCYTGPTVQPMLLTILINFRLPKYAVTADIEKMYRQIVVHSDDRPLQQIVWRKHPSDTIKTYQLNTVTYGTAPAPYLATRVLNQLSEDEAENYPLAALKVKTTFYVDDHLSGDDDEQQLIDTNKQLIALLQSGGFTLRKWSSNNKKVLAHIPSSHRDTRSELEIGQCGPVKTLGLNWHPDSDNLTFNVPEFDPSKQITKRSVLSELSRLFDPLGLVGAAIVTAKIFLQSLWAHSYSWTDPLQQDHNNWWLQYREEIGTLKSLIIPRWTLVDNQIGSELHCFSDASDRAYGCCVYVKTMKDDGTSVINLVISKSRVSPLTKLSTPRLELCAAVLAAQLAAFVLDSSKLNCKVTYWTDSTIVLHWLASSSSVWKVFVSNRIAEIHRLTRGSSWRHVPTNLNPADRISRGVFPSKIIGDGLWWHGPTFLHKSEEDWPPNCITLSPLHLQVRNLEARQSVAVVTTIVSPTIEFVEQHSSLSHLQRITAWLLRFTNNCRTDRTNRLVGPLSCGEIDNALKHLIKQTQSSYFAAEIRFLQKHGNYTQARFNFKSQLGNCNTMLDAENILRIDGRLQQLDAPFDTRHPMILPQKAHLTLLIARAIHIRTLHSGPQLLLATIRQRFWPIRGRDVTRKVFNECLVCFRCKPKPASQIMGQLPSVRLTPSRAFVSCGVDYCGPFYVRTPNRRGSPVKIHVAIFVCMWSKAVHIDMVYSLTSVAFINTLKRLVGRRGHVSRIYCDNARTFVGANRMLQDAQHEFMKMHHSESVTTHCSETGISFHFSPARSPHHGGLWEAAVKIFKHHLYRVMKDTTLTIDDFNTLIIQIEGIMNSRPLTPMSSDPADVVALTPGHFLVGEPLYSLPEPDLCEISINRLKSFQKMQQRLQHFWKAWSRDYIGQLQNRKKWPVALPNICIGTMVLLKNECIPPMCWKLGRIEQLFFGNDGKVRVVHVRTANGNYRRAITEVSIAHRTTNSGR